MGSLNLERIDERGGEQHLKKTFIQVDPEKKKKYFLKKGELAASDSKNHLSVSGDRETLGKKEKAAWKVT